MDKNPNNFSKNEKPNSHSQFLSRRSLVLAGATGALILPTTCGAIAAVDAKKKSPPMENNDDANWKSYCTNLSLSVENMNRIDEGLNSADANVRLATLETIMNVGSSAEKTKALNMAFASSDKNLRYLAVKHLWARRGKQTFLVEKGNLGTSQSKAYSLVSQFSITIENFDFATGKFDSLLEISNDTKGFVTKNNSIYNNNISYSNYFFDGSASLTMSMLIDKDGYISGSVAFKFSNQHWNFSSAAAGFLLQ